MVTCQSRDNYNRRTTDVLIFLNDVLTQRQRYEDSDADYNHHYIYNTNTFELTT